MSMNHLVGGRAFTLFGRTRKGESGWNRTVDSFLIRDEAGRSIFGIPRGDVTIIGRCGGRGGEEREREKEGKPDGMERTRGMRGQALVGDVQVSSRAKILHFDVSQFYLIVCNALVAGDFFIDLFVENNTSNACNFV